MTGSVDIERLAEYAAGLLARREAESVARLIATDPGWARAYAALPGALSRTAEVLGTLPAVPMPEHVQTYASAAWRADAATAGATSKRQGSRSHHRAPGAGAPRARWWRPATALAVSAAAAAAVGFALASLHSSGSSSSTSGNSQAAPALRAPASSATPGGVIAGVATIASGTDYAPASVAALGAAPRPSPGTVPSTKAAFGTAGGTAAPQDRNAAPTGLARLASPTALAGCLHAIALVQPGDPTLVDFARYQGQPALIVSLAAPTAASTGHVVVVGPDCGLNGADVIYIAST